MEKIKEQMKNGEPVTEAQIHQAANDLKEDITKDIEDIFDKYTKEYDINIATISENGVAVWNLGKWIADVKGVVLSTLSKQFSDC